VAAASEKSKTTAIAVAASPKLEMNADDDEGNTVSTSWAHMTDSLALT
jgi:hypothetical protein